VQLKLVEDTDQRLVYKMGALAMLCHMSLCTLIAAVVSFSLTLFLRHYIGIFAFVFVAFPGLVLVTCGFFGCANARQFTFSFDRTEGGAAGSFVAAAGGARVCRSLSEIRLIHIERESGSGGLFGGEAPSFAAAVLFADGHRCRLEGGVSITGSGRGPDHLQAAAEKIRAFLNLPQQNIPLLSINRAAKEQQSAADAAQAEAGLSRWLACQGIAPRLEPPLANYEWVEPPLGPVRLPAAFGLLGSLPLGGLGGGGVIAGQALGPAQGGGPRWARPPGMSLDPGLGPVVMGRPQPQAQPQPRAIQVVVPEGMVGQVMTVMAPDGAQITVTVPADMRPGDPMTIQY